MKKLFLFLFIALLCSAFISDKEHNPTRGHSFAKGENLEFKLHFGIFTVGKAKIEVHPQVYDINDKSCYKVDVYGWTTGAVGLLAKVDDNWGAYIDSTHLLPQISWRNIKEGKYRKNELVNFDHSNDVVEAKVIDNKTGKFKDPVYYDAPNNTRDIIGGYMHIRHIDYKGLDKLDTIRMNAFFEDTIYDFRIMYMGKDRVKTKAGEFNTIKLIPIMPENKLFSGENPITMWLSDDKNRILLKAEASMVIGKAGVELTKFEGLKNRPNFYD